MSRLPLHPFLVLLLAGSSLAGCCYEDACPPCDSPAGLGCPVAAPSSLVVNAVSEHEIDLLWQDNSDNEDGFRVERCNGDSCADFSEIATVGRNTISYQDTGLRVGTSYAYRVMAYNALGTSGYSNSVRAATAADFSGNWSGSVSDNHGSGALVLGLIQTGETVGGSYSVRNAATGQTSAGTVSAWVAGLILSGTGTGGYGSCVQTLSFTAQISDTVLSGTYSGIDSCAGGITDGRFTLTRASSDWRLTGYPAQAGVTEFAVNGSDYLFAAVQGGNVGTTGPGLFRSTDNGTTWFRHNSGLTNTNVKGVTVTSNGDVYIGTHGDGVWRSTDAGQSWSPTGLAGQTIEIMFSRGSSIYALDGFWCTGVHRSRDNGVTWSTINNGLAPCVNGIAVTAAGDLFVATGTSGAFRSTDDANSWSAVNAGLGTSNLSSVVVSPNGYVYVGTVGAGVFRSVDNGGSWMPANNGLPAQALVQGLGVSPGGQLFAGIAGVPGVFGSTNAGTSWLPFNSGLDTPNGVGAIGFQSSGYAVVSDGTRIWRSSRPLR
jgi:Fibronectin type III domain